MLLYAYFVQHPRLVEVSIWHGTWREEEYEMQRAMV
jgi:hypothetical protein